MNKKYNTWHNEGMTLEERKASYNVLMKPNEYRWREKKYLYIWVVITESIKELLPVGSYCISLGDLQAPNDSLDSDDIIEVASKTGGAGEFGIIDNTLYYFEVNRGKKFYKEFILENFKAYEKEIKDFIKERIL